LVPENGESREVERPVASILGAPTKEQQASEHSFDQLAKEIANGAMPRKRALKVAGASLLGSVFLGLIPGVAEAKKKKKKKKCPKPPTCGNGISTGCFQCGTPTTALEFCLCVPGADGAPHCVNATQGSGNPCTTNADCSGGELCVNGAPCNGGGPPNTVCAPPCT
jgi:hypothetical protein